MNTPAVMFGVLYGTVTAIVFYAVSMLTSGLFARPFYRLYAKLLIGVCCMMLAAPALRWLATVAPGTSLIGLTFAQYAAMGILMVGVVRFNREFMQRIFLKRATTAYFIFGTLANATIVTLIFLHFAVTGASTWQVPRSDAFYLTVGHYGPIVLLLAAMILHTDYYLKAVSREIRTFSRFTFVGYAVSFLGIALSIVPFFGQALAALGLSSTEWLLLQNASCAQTLLIAIVLYAWLIWRYESIPPTFLLLIAIVLEYHVLVTQWSIRWLGPASWGLASLPLFIGISLLSQYFTRWDQRKAASRSKNRSNNNYRQSKVSILLRRDDCQSTQDSDCSSDTKLEPAPDTQFVVNWFCSRTAAEICTAFPAGPSRFGPGPDRGDVVDAVCFRSKRLTAVARCDLWHLRPVHGRILSNH